MTETIGKSDARTRTNEGKWILVMCGAYTVLAGASAILPRFAANGQDGLAGAATAAMSFLLLAVLALVTGVVALVMTVRAWNRLSVGMRVAGLSPAVLSVVGTLAIMAALERSREQAPESPPMSSKTIAPPATSE